MSGTRADGKPNDTLPGDVIASIVRNGVCLKVGLEHNPCVEANAAWHAVITATCVPKLPLSVHATIANLKTPSQTVMCQYTAHCPQTMAPVVAIAKSALPSFFTGACAQRRVELGA